MYKFKTDEMKVPVFVWSPEGSIEDGAIQQIKNAASLPFAFHHVSLMPDGHQGFGAPIGGVVAAEQVVIPNFVGVDIGCGMCALKTPWTTEEIDQETLKKLFGGSKEHRGGIRTVVPVGFDRHGEKQDEKFMPWRDNGEQNYSKLPIVLQEYESALKQIGTLGGGNHFIEIQKDNEGCIWIMIHSGSRNIGYKVANYYNDLAKELTRKWFSYGPKEWDLAFLPVDSNEGQAYLKEMQYCVDFALANRKLMMERIADVFDKILNWKKIDLNGMINIAHNYATLESHFGKNVMVHRKGATLAREGTVGIIPGSQGTKSYIVHGKGNPESFMSCSHGAGRTMSRTKAENTLDLEAEKKKLDDQGIVHGIRTKKDLDEAAGAYKNIADVMKNQEDLVEIVVELSPLGVIKG